MISNDEVKIAMVIIQMFCEDRDALEYPCTGCPMERNCKYSEKPDTWMLTE